MFGECGRYTMDGVIIPKQPCHGSALVEPMNDVSSGGFPKQLTLKANRKRSQHANFDQILIVSCRSSRKQNGPDEVAEIQRGKSNKLFRRLMVVQIQNIPAQTMCLSLA